MTFTVRTDGTFEGTINGVLFVHQQMFDTVEYLLNYMESHFGEILNLKPDQIQFKTDFVEDLKLTIKDVWYKYDDISLGEIEAEFRDCIETATNFDDLQFDISGETWKIEDLNQKLEACVYNFVKQKGTTLMAYDSRGHTPNAPNHAK